MTVDAPTLHPAAAAPARLFDDIACGVNGSRTAYEAVRQAAQLGGPNASLTLVAVTGVHGSSGSTASVAPARAQRALAYARRLVEGEVANVATEVDGGFPVADALFRRAGGHGVLAIGPPVMGRAAHLLFGGTATAAAHRLPASLLIARRPAAGVAFGGHLLVASDMLERSDALVEFAIGLARERDATLTLLHAPHGEASHHPTRIAGQVERASRELGERAAVRIEPGRPLEVILAAAAADRCSLVIVGSRRVGGLRSLGSVSERVVHDARCSVLVLRPEDLGGTPGP